ncbi:hypothetical protein TR51_25505 [Kitasatospora griseola]|uniref:Uncharacterized protein n=1 Tax=Kitasatospora griseola TaxID=2064 RepID=A0A0D0NTB2_KITGR|nr:phage tail assembly protein [Kitasatospora griseola]KIQ62401.1 hypothetical protein TR51_25505 [Kitasatospora griseola]
MSTKITFEDLIAEVENAYEIVEFVGPDGTVFAMRSLVILPREARRSVVAAVAVANNKSADVDQQETAIDKVLVSVVDKPSEFQSVLDALPLGAKVKLIEAWSEGTQAGEA